MANCFSCGAETARGLHPRYSFTCPRCAQVEEIKSLRRQVSDDLTQLSRIQEHGFKTLSDRLSGVATIIEWGFEGVNWELRQQTDVLRSMDDTLRTPSQTRANEWRQIAEELRNRRILDQSEEFFLKALEASPLDYRIYVGLAQTYLQTEKFDEAKTLLEKSLPHAPVETGFDYKSYSYRLIGRIYFCEGNYDQAASVLHKSAELSPRYWEGHYDHAQYCALVGNKEDSLASLQKAISGNSLCFSLAQKERNFAPLRDEIDKWLRGHRAKILRETQEAISLAESRLSQLTKAIPIIEYTWLRSLGWSERHIKRNEVSVAAASRVNEPETLKLYNEAQFRLQAAKGHIYTEDYTQLLTARDIALESKALALEANAKACVEREALERAIEWRAEEEKRDNWQLAELFLFIGGIAAFIAAVITDDLTFAPIGGILWGLALVFHLVEYRRNSSD